MNLPHRSGVYPVMDARLDPDPPPAPMDSMDASPPPAPDVEALRPAEPPLEFATFYRQSHPTIARALAYTVGDTALGIEAADEAMARAYARWSVIGRYDNPAAWVHRVGLNWARSVLRRTTRRLPLRPRVDAVEPPVADPAVADALAQLEVRLRAVVVCRLLLDWSIDDTADALGIKPGTVKSRYHRALRILQSSLQHLR